MNRRGFLKGMLAAPAVILTPGLLMRVKPVFVHDSVSWELCEMDFADAEVRGVSLSLSEIISETFRKHRPSIIRNIEAHNALLKRLYESA